MSGDIVVRRFDLRPVKDFAGFVIFDRRSAVEERRVITDSGGLLHVVCDDDNRILILQLHQGILNRRS